MSTSIARPRTETKPRTERPKVYKVILLNDDYTPREFVVVVLRSVFRMTTDQAHGVMLTAHMRGSCVVAVYTREIAETKATQAIDMAAGQGYPLMFVTEPED
jgi:ATP-dependent Clp protease adaptor protein ClpS